MEAHLPPKVAALVNESKSVRRGNACFEIDLPGQPTPLQIFDQVTRMQNRPFHIQHTVALDQINIIDLIHTHKITNIGP